MRKGCLACGLMAMWMFASSAYAEPIDSTLWLKDGYVGVGAIDVPKLAQRRIYAYLMDFFVTDKNVKQAFSVIRSAGIVFEEILSRIVVGLPADVAKSEHIILWETTQDLSQYKTILATYDKTVDKRMHQGMEYYATKRENECIAIIGNVLALGSELKVKTILETHKAGYAGGVTNGDLQAMLKRADKSGDAWFVFALGKAQRESIGRGDPVIDMTAEGKGAIRLGDLQSGAVSLEFSKGLQVSSLLTMTDETSAQQMTKAVSSLISDAKKDADVQALGFDAFLPGIQFKSSKSDIFMTISYDQATFDRLIALVTQFVKSIPGQPQAAPAAQNADAARAPAKRPTQAGGGNGAQKNEKAQ